ncbi:hypothetical protein [Thioalkalivibrio sp. XN279]|uniref:hypothetical protein n=1 Tax=Thioalkalivibrio sp. XN279 TaxID=2714953 RepID=UPI00140A2A1E|nr:hypothetical protein [Thioalkalivibrio sp. XN279]NHA14234.1 hypothetical protein [Thioalkalivibrio sp. XN279]
MTSSSSIPCCNRLGACRFPGLHLARLFALVLLCWAGLATAAAPEISREQMKGLDEQVQEIKADVLAIAAELSQLEERLLFPSSTQLSVFVSLEEGASYRLDAVEVQLAGRPVAHHIYSFKELEALQKGGVQRLFTGNLPSGEHELVVTVSGKLRSGADFRRSENFKFTKGVEPKMVAISLGQPDGDGIGVALGNW